MLNAVIRYMQTVSHMNLEQLFLYQYQAETIFANFLLLRGHFAYWIATNMTSDSRHMKYNWPGKTSLGYSCGQFSNCHAVKSLIRPFITSVAEYTSYQITVPVQIIVVEEKILHEIHGFPACYPRNWCIFHTAMNCVKIRVFCNTIIRLFIVGHMRRAPAYFFMH